MPYAVGYNDPGYLPDDPSHVWHTREWADAREYLKGLLDPDDVGALRSQERDRKRGPATYSPRISLAVPTRRAGGDFQKWG